MRALILTWDKFQDHELIYPYYALKQYGFDVTLMASKKGKIWGSLGTHMECDAETREFNDYYESLHRYIQYDLLVIPGGVKALEKLRLESQILPFIKEWFAQNKMVFCICNGAQLLITADVLRGRKCSGYYSIEPDIRNAGAEYSRDNVVIDGNLVSCPHYDFMGQWLREGFRAYESQQKALGL